VAAALPLLVAITGPTGTGKSALGLALAEQLRAQLPLEIISMDSAQVYRGLDIGTAKPDAAARATVAHHLLDIRDPAQSYSAGAFARDASALIADIHARGRVPLLLGGTLLYLRALEGGLAPLPPACLSVRRELEAQATEIGWAGLHAELQRVDATAAQRIARTDAQRIQRALEVYRVTGQPISHWQQQARAAAAGTRAQFRWLRFALLPPSRLDLRAHLAARFHAMLAAGLLAEVRALHARGDLSEQHPSMRAVGYRQLWQHCEARVSLADATELAITATAQLAKRQLTWLRREVGFIPVSAADVGLSEVLARAILDAARA
jgi:tRNA dimethylallyltransferase